MARMHQEHADSIGAIILASVEMNLDDQRLDLTGPSSSTIAATLDRIPGFCKRLITQLAALIKGLGRDE